MRWVVQRAEHPDVTRQVQQPSRPPGFPVLPLRWSTYARHSQELGHDHTPATRPRAHASPFSGQVQNTPIQLATPSSQSKLDPM